MKVVYTRYNYVLYGYFNTIRRNFDMACFLVPAAEAVVTTIITKAVRSKEKKQELIKGDFGFGMEERAKAPFSSRLRWLSNLLWGGSALLAFEHLWHGELVPWFPFLTAAGSTESAGIMLREMAAVGSAMSLAVTGIWACMLLVSKHMEKKAVKKLANAARE